MINRKRNFVASAFTRLKLKKNKISSNGLNVPNMGGTRKVFRNNEGMRYLHFFPFCQSATSSKTRAMKL